MRALISIALVVLLAGCASSGNKIDQNQISQIHAGETTLDQMTAIFGQPVGQGYNSDGNLSVNWMYVYAGPFGTGMEQQVLSALFDSDGKVIKYNMLNGSPGGVRLGR